MSKAERIQEARDLFGDLIVSETLSLVALSDPDGAYTHFEDCGMEDHASCVEIIYFSA